MLNSVGSVTGPKLHGSAWPSGQQGLASPSRCGAHGVPPWAITVSGSPVEVQTLPVTWPVRRAAADGYNTSGQGEHAEHGGEAAGLTM
jgi:hypothetical protein